MSVISFWEQLLSRLGGMDILSWYIFICGWFFGLWLLFYRIYRLIHSEWPLTNAFMMGHFVYPHIFPRIPFLGAATRLQLLILSLYIITNVILITARADSAERSTRAASMAIINLIPLLWGPRLSLVAQLFGISLRASVGCHQWLGRIAVVQMLFHTVVEIAGRMPFVWTTKSMTGVVASSAVGLIFLSSISFIRRALYEWFLNSHLLLSVVILLAAWRHISSKKPAQLFLRIGVCLWTVATTFHWLLFANRNFAFGKPFATAKARRLPRHSEDVMSDSLVDQSSYLEVEITVPKPWQVQAGQSVFLSIPRLGIFTGLRGHPFMICWWDRDQNGLTISILVKPRDGFTAELTRHTEKPLLAFIDGPYGTRHDFGDYSTVIMLATGIGIASHIPYIKELITGYNNCLVKTRRIRLIWEVKEQCQMRRYQALHRAVTDLYLILHVLVHVQLNGKDMKHGNHGRIEETKAPLDVKAALEAEFGTQKGRFMVSVCADKLITDKTRRHVRRRMDKWVRFVEMDFQPSLREGPWLTTFSDMEFSCRG